MLDLAGKIVHYRHQHRQGQISVDELLEKSYHFFDAYFHQVRNRVMFGSRVQGWLTEIESGIAKEYRAKGLQELVSMMAVAKLAPTKGFLVKS